MFSDRVSISLPSFKAVKLSFVFSSHVRRGAHEKRWCCFFCVVALGGRIPLGFFIVRCMNIKDPRIDSMLVNAKPKPAVQLAVIAMTAEMYVGAQILAQLSQGILRTEEAYHDEALPSELVDKALAMTKDFLQKLG